MIRIWTGQEEIHLEEHEWRLWVEDGRIPPRAQVWVDGAWIPAHEWSGYRSVHPAPEPPAPRVDVLPVIFPRRGLSSTETVILMNLAVAGALGLLWGGRYRVALRELATTWWEAVTYQQAYWWWIPPSVIHVDLQHLGSNMISLIAGAGAIEFLSGSRWVFVVYLVTAIGCSALSYVGHDGPPLSVGASGAVFGFVGAVITLVIRRYHQFSHRQQWKSRRIYSALFVIFVLPSIFGADYWGHLGGFLAGLLIGPFLPLHERFQPTLKADG